MTGLLSAISGHFTKAWILGALFPSVIFVFLFLVFVAPLLPPGVALAAPAVFGTEWNVLSVTFFTLVLSALLSSLDTQLIQLYEGYPWQNSLLGRGMAWLQRRKMEALRRRSGLLWELAADDGTPERTVINSARSEAGKDLLQNFPDEPRLVLPTRFGNIMRAFERYPWVQYGMDAIYLWPRLVAVIPEPYALSYLTGVLCVATVAAGLAYLPPDPAAHVLAPAAVFLGASVWLYHRSFDAAADWGHFVKGAFDLYRGELLKKMGYQQQPLSRAKERDLWNRISYQVMGGDEPVELKKSLPWVEYADPPGAATLVRADDGVELELTRAVEGPGFLRELRVVVVVRNQDAEHRDAKNVELVEVLPEGMAYRWNSARLDGAAATVTGIGPYRFALRDVPYNATITLTYTACATDSGNGSRACR
jgi:hypothetical protein